MVRITTEDAWLSCGHPLNLSYYCRGKLEVQRFRWLAADWGGRIRHLFDKEDLQWFNAFASWVAGSGLPPGQVCRPKERYSKGRQRYERHWAGRCAEAIRCNNPKVAAAAAGTSASYDCSEVHHRAGSDPDRNEWRAARQTHVESVRREFCDQFRDVAGNPFRSVILLPDWRTSTVLALARAIERAYDRLPILADALQDAGCEEDQLLAHCRGPGPHVKGCWVIDLLLGLPLFQASVGDESS